ncbi:MAG: glycosyltransferase family 4 protein [Sulfuritalea sp.]|nr:glycosyltransferase family 4 protein [Sulfuritalea sp.]
MRLAYLINRYPSVSHSFIRREIRAMERQGCAVLRIGLRGWDAELADPQDERERELTRYVLQQGLLPLLGAVLRVLLGSPRRFGAALVQAVRLGLRADRPLPYHMAYLAEACRALLWLRAFGASHVHAHFGSNAAEVALLIRILGGPPYSFTVHGPEEFDKPEFLALREKVSSAAFVVAVSSFGRGQLYRWLPQREWRKVKIVRCGIERDFHAHTIREFPAAARLVCVGRLCEQKGQLLLVEAMHHLAGRGKRFELVLAGDGPMRGEIEDLVARYGLKAQIRLTGWIGGAQVREEILAAQGLVLPSFAEGLPVVIMEAFAMGRPVLSTYVAGIPELVRAGENGWLFPAGSVENLAAALEEFLATPPARLESMGVAGRRRVLACHDVDAEAARLVGLVGAAREGTDGEWA